MRLIDAVVVEERLWDARRAYQLMDNSQDADKIMHGIYNAEQIIREATTVDAVPVVRCKDCKHRPTKPDDYNPITTDGFALEFPDEKCPCQCGDGWYSKYPDDDWYCPIGERKGGDE